MNALPLFPKKRSLRRPGRRTQASRSSVATAILLVLVASIVPFAEAEIRTEQSLDYALSRNDIFVKLGLIHGWGFLSYENLTFTRVVGEDDELERSVAIDIVVSTLPEYDGKDWLKDFDFTRNDDPEFWKVLGIGGTSFETSEYFTCCTDEAFELGICQETGKIIISDPSDEKVVTQAKILPGNIKNEPLSTWKSSARFSYTTPFVLIIANCDPNVSRDVLVDGDLVWVSYTSLSSIPTKLVLAMAHLGLFFWYRYKMAQNISTRIQIEVWISGVLALAAFASVVVMLYVSLEAICSREVLWLRVLSDFATKTTQVVSRCLYVAIALGLGVTKMRLSIFTQFAIVALGLAVLFSKETADVMGDVSFARRDNNFGDAFNQNRHEFLKLQFKLNMLFVVWIPLALLWTMWRMRTMDVEPQKLRRHRWLFGLYFFSWLITSGMVGTYMLMRYGPHKGHGSPFSFFFRGNSVDRAVVDEICSFAYWITLLCMAILWKPNPEAPMYGYVLLTDNGDQEGGESPKNENGSTPRNSVMELAEFSSPGTDTEEVHHELSLQVETVMDEEEL